MSGELFRLWQESVDCKLLNAMIPGGTVRVRRTTSREFGFGGAVLAVVGRLRIVLPGRLVINEQDKPE